jgi:hypothetical protein
MSITDGDDHDFTVLAPESIALVLTFKALRCIEADYVVDKGTSGRSSPIKPFSAEERKRLGQEYIGPPPTREVVTRARCVGIFGEKKFSTHCELREVGSEWVPMCLKMFIGHQTLHFKISKKFRDDYVEQKFFEVSGPIDIAVTKTKS